MSKEYANVTFNESVKPIMSMKVWEDSPSFTYELDCNFKAAKTTEECVIQSAGELTRYKFFVHCYDVAHSQDGHVPVMGWRLGMAEKPVGSIVPRSG